MVIPWPYGPIFLTGRWEGYLYYNLIEFDQHQTSFSCPFNFSHFRNYMGLYRSFVALRLNFLYWGAGGGTQELFTKKDPKSKNINLPKEIKWYLPLPTPPWIGPWGTTLHKDLAFFFFINLDPKEARSAKKCLSKKNIRLSP